MQRIDFDELLNRSFNVSKIEAVERTWRDGNVNRYPEGRGENIISYTFGGSKFIADYEGGAQYELSAPAVVLISKGTPYLSQTLLSGDETLGRTVCIRFALLDDNGEELCLGEPFCIWKNDHDGKLLQAFRGVLSAYLATDASPMTVKARMYELLHLLCLKKSDRGLSKAARQILPAVEHIEKYPELNTSVTELAAMCFLSESYFRVQFRGHFGCSPTDYRNRLRVEKAQELLDSSLWTTELIAEKLGFCDTSHFYRVYKKIMGTTPRKLGKSE